MPGVVERVVRERAEREGVFVGIGSVADQAVDEFAGSHVVCQVREEVAAERVVPEVLNQRAAVRIGAGFLQLCRREVPEAMLEQHGELAVPRRVDGLEVGDDREGACRSGPQQRCPEGQGEQKAMEPSGHVWHAWSNCKVSAEGDLSRGSPATPCRSWRSPFV